MLDISEQGKGRVRCIRDKTSLINGDKGRSYFIRSVIASMEAAQVLIFPPSVLANSNQSALNAID